MQAEAAQYKAALGGREQEVRELEGDIGQAVADVRDALHREVAALAQAEDERAVGAFQVSGCNGRWLPSALR